MYIAFRTSKENLELPTPSEIGALSTVMVFDQTELRHVERIIRLILQHVPPSDDLHKQLSKLLNVVRHNLPARYN